MAIVSDSMSPADIAAVTGNSGNNNGWNDGSVWIWVLFLFALMGGWGNNGSNGGGYPAMSNTVQSGFDQAAVMSGLNGINSSVSNGFASAEVSRCNGQTNILQSLNNVQSGLSNQLNTIAMAQLQANANNLASVADLKFNVATEACADRAAVTNALEAVTAQNNANTQRILDQICQDKLEAKDAEINNLRTQLNLVNLAASQNQQTATILADNAAQTARLLPQAPIPAYIVSNPSCCNGQGYYGYGCGV